MVQIEVVDGCFIALDRCMESCDGFGTSTTTTTTISPTLIATTIKLIPIANIPTTPSTETNCANNCYEEWAILNGSTVQTNCYIGKISCPSTSVRLHYDCTSASVKTTDLSTTSIKTTTAKRPSTLPTPTTTTISITTTTIKKWPKQQQHSGQIQLSGWSKLIWSFWGSISHFHR